MNAVIVGRGREANDLRWGSCKRVRV